MTALTPGEQPTMYWEGALGATMEVAIAIAGFAGIVTGLAQREAFRWDPVHRLRLQILLAASAAALTMSFLPFLLLEAGLTLSQNWMVASAIQALWFISVPVYRSRQIRALPIDYTYDRTVSGIVIAVMVPTALLNAVWLHSAGPYLLCVGLQLLVAFSAFTSLVMTAVGASNPVATETQPPEPDREPQ